MRSLILTVVFVGFSLSAYGTVITFNSVPSSGNPDQAPSLTTQGFTFASGHFHTIDTPTLCSFGGCVSNGTIYLAVDGPSLGQPITMTVAGGGTFTLNGFDGDKLWMNDAEAAAGGFPNATAITLSAAVNGGGTLTDTFMLTDSTSFQTFTLPNNWTNLLSVTFMGTTGATLDTSFALDNVVVNASSVPEPATAATAGLVLAACLVLAQRRARRQLRRSSSCT